MSTKTDEQIKLDIANLKGSKRLLEQQAAAAGGFRSDVHGDADRLADDARAAFAARAGMPGGVGRCFVDRETAFLFLVSSDAYRAAVHEAIDSCPAEAFAAEDSKALDAKLNKLDGEIAPLEAELEKRDKARAALETKLAAIGAGEAA